MLGSFITKRDLPYNLRHASTFLRDKVSITSCGTESVRILEPKIWDLLPYYIKYAENLDSFQAKIKNWELENCPRRQCKTFIEEVFFL